MGRPSSEEISHHHIALQGYNINICGILEDRHTREHRLDSIEEDGEGQQKGNVVYCIDHSLTRREDHSEFVMENQYEKTNE